MCDCVSRLCTMDEDAQLVVTDNTFTFCCRWWVCVGGSLEVAHQHWTDIEGDGKHETFLKNIKYIGFSDILVFYGMLPEDILNSFQISSELNFHKFQIR